MRLDCGLCSEEQAFLSRRKQVVAAALKKALQLDQDLQDDEVWGLSTCGWSFPHACLGPGLSAGRVVQPRAGVSSGLSLAGPAYPVPLPRCCQDDTWGTCSSQMAVSLCFLVPHLTDDTHL